MAFLAKRFSVCLIPEQPLIAPMRDNVIHERCRNDLSLSLAESAQRTLFQEKRRAFCQRASYPRAAAPPIFSIDFSLLIFRFPVVNYKIMIIKDKSGKLNPALSLPEIYKIYATHPFE